MKRKQRPDFHRDKQRSGQRNITPHEPDQPIAGVAEAINDSDAMVRVWRERERRVSQALQRLRDAGMNVLGASPPRPKRRQERRVVK